jgi:hypothetical protein
MSNRNTGGPAFPVPAELCQDLTIEQQRGMTLRDYFAAKAMQSMAQKYSHEGDISRNAYKVADAMLKAREA